MSRKKNNVSNSNLDEKMDKLLDKFEVVEKKMDKRMNAIEEKCNLLNKKSAMHEKKQTYLVREVAKLKGTVNEMEQEKLKCNIIIQGIPEIESEPNCLIDMVESFLRHLDNTMKKECMQLVKRFGPKKSREGFIRPILVKFNDEDIKANIMQAKKSTQTHCGIFTTNNKKWGTTNDKIFISDHLTQMNSQIFWQMRQWKKSNKIKYAWTKMGKIYIKKSDEDPAILVRNLDHVSALIKEFRIKQVASSTKIDEDSESDPTSTESESSSPDTTLQDEYEGEEQVKKLTNKRHRSHTSDKKSPRPKRGCKK